MYVTVGASELSVKTCCQLWEDGDTPPVLKESALHFRSAQNQQRIDTLIIQARRQFHHRNTSLACWLHCRRQGLAWLVVESSGRRASNLIWLTQEVASSGSIESLCLQVSLVHIESPTGSRAEPAMWLVSAGVVQLEG